ncbi:MAG: hypothetical protein ACRC92_25490 [Peptostreptococcaceae bacterium]
MKKRNYYIKVSIILVILSAIMFYIHYLVFGQAENTAYYSLMNLCFIPINSLVVTILLEKLIDAKEKKERMNKLDMLVGLFFSEIGYNLMHQIIKGDVNAKNFILNFNKLDDIEARIIKYDYYVDINEIDIQEVKALLINNNDLLINLISNENLHQHETFTDLLMAVIHLRDEILFMEKYGCSLIDNNHLENDINRVYKNITIQWINYLKYLQNNYPFLYNNAIRVNPYKFNN